MKKRHGIFKKFPKPMRYYPIVKNDPLTIDLGKKVPIMPIKCRKGVECPVVECLVFILVLVVLVGVDIIPCHQKKPICYFPTFLGVLIHSVVPLVVEAVARDAALEVVLVGHPLCT
jgi:hypothetical protein